VVASLKSSAADRIPMAITSEQSLPGLNHDAAPVNGVVACHSGAPLPLGRPAAGESFVGHTGILRGNGATAVDPVVATLAGNFPA